MNKIAAYNFQALLEGALSLLPGFCSFFRNGTRGTDSARYCYAVWMRHFVKMQPFHNGCLGRVVELGPGDSLGTGLAALLCGAERYYAVDAVEHACPERDARVLEELIRLFRAGASIPTHMEFPEVKPILKDYRFPRYAPRDLGLPRYNALKLAIRDRGGNHPIVSYVQFDEARKIIPSESVNLIFSQAVLEHVDDLESLYQSCHKWLRPGGLMSHQIDFKSHGTSREWNGHWAYPEPIWRLIRGSRRYLLNRQPCGVHLNAIEHAGFEVMSQERVRIPSRLTRSQLGNRMAHISEDDLNTAGIYLIARKSAAEQNT